MHRRHGRSSGAGSRRISRVAKAASRATTPRPTGTTPSGMACGDGGRASSMPAIEFVNLSDHELSDIVAYIRSMPPVDRDPGASEVRTGVFSFIARIRLVSACCVGSRSLRRRTRSSRPKPRRPQNIGEHLVQVCRGCHGPICRAASSMGDPDMPVVANLTPHETGLKDWTEADFVRALREGKRKDGTADLRGNALEGLRPDGRRGTEGDLRVPADRAAACRKAIAERRAARRVRRSPCASPRCAPACCRSSRR